MHGYMYEDRGEMASTFIVCFALSSAVSGFTSGSFYRWVSSLLIDQHFFSSHKRRQCARKHFTSSRAEINSEWQKAMIATCLLLPIVVVTTISILNSIAIYYDTVNAIPALVITKMVAVWLFVSFPLSIIGTIFGRHFVGKSELPCRVNSIPRYVSFFSHSSSFFLSLFV